MDHAHGAPTPQGIAGTTIQEAEAHGDGAVQPQVGECARVDILPGAHVHELSRESDQRPP